MSDPISPSVYIPNRLAYLAEKMAVNLVAVHITNKPMAPAIVDKVLIETTGISQYTSLAPDVVHGSDMQVLIDFITEICRIIGDVHPDPDPTDPDPDPDVIAEAIQILQKYTHLSYCGGNSETIRECIWECNNV